MTNPQPVSHHRQDIVVIGLGNTLRRDDGVGALALDACRYAGLPHCDLVEVTGSPQQIVDAWRDRETAIVIDAVCVGAPAGTVHDRSLDHLDDAAAVDAALSGAHFAAVSEALVLGRQHGQLPKSLRVLGIEPGDLKRGFGLSPPVAASMGELVRRIRSAANPNDVIELAQDNL